MSKKVCIVFNCHGNEISKFLLSNIYFVNNYILSTIILNKYTRDSNYTDWQPTDKKQIGEADILILQIIEKDRGFINNNETIKLVKPDCIIIKIPHYRCQVYNYKIIGGLFNKEFILNHTELINRINDVENINETIEIIKDDIKNVNQIDYDPIELETYKNNSINEFLRINSVSSIDMSDYFLNNYKSLLLFKARGYPSSIFFYELTNRILKQLDIDQTVPFVDSYFAENTSTPISDYWYRFCNFTFDNTFYTYHHIEMKDYEFYYMLIYHKKTTILDRKIINDFCVRIREQYNKIE